MTTPLTLLLIRHAQSLGNAEGRMMGILDDDLSELGILQARELAERLRSHPPTHVYSSPTARACQTTEILMQSLPESDRIPVIYRDELKEFQNGIFQGLTWAEAKAQHPALCQQLESSLTWIPIPGAESLEEGRDRAHRFISFLLDTHSDQEHIWVISHSWLMQQLIASILGSDRTWGTAIDYTALFEFQIWRSLWQTQSDRLNTELWRINRFNDTQHLHRFEKNRSFQ